MTRERCLPDVARVFVFRFNMFDPHMDEYLDEEVEAVKRSFESICRDWEQKVKHFPFLNSILLADLHFRTNPTQSRRTYHPPELDS